MNVAPRLGIHHRIVIPFAAVSLLAILAAALVSRAFISRTLEARVRAQIVSASVVAAQIDFALNPSVLRLVKEVAGADVVTYTPGGGVLATTLNRTADADLLAAVTAAQPGVGAGSPPDPAPVFRQVIRRGTPYYVAYRRVSGRPDAVVALVAETSELAAATRALTRAVLVVALVALAAMAVAGRVVARRVTKPLGRLASYARELAAGGTPPAPPRGADEVGRLAGAFADMVEQLRVSQDRLLRTEKLALAGLLAARVAHDIRNPLSSVKMQTQLLRTRLRGDAESQAILQSVLDGVEQVEEVVRGLLELARPGELSKRRMALNQIVETVLRRAGPQLAHRKIAVETALAPDLPDTSLDPGRFEHALSNVIVNAAEAMPSGGTLSIATTMSPDGSTLVLDVCDDGIGIATGMLGRVFDPFVSTKRDGVGLGLVNTKAIVESHGGAIAIARREPKGTRARITLPVGG